MNAANFAAFASFAFLPALCLRMEDVVVVRAFGSAAGLWWLAFLPSAGVAPEPEGTPEPLHEPAEGSAESRQRAFRDARFPRQGPVRRVAWYTVLALVNDSSDDHLRGDAKAHASLKNIADYASSGRKRSPSRSREGIALPPLTA